jgi:acetoin utilization protein AcuB
MARTRSSRKETIMHVRELMTPNPITVGPDMPVLEARQIMFDQRIRHLLVVGDDRLQGMVTDRDIRLSLPSQATSLSVWEVNYLLARLTVGKVMSTKLITIGPSSAAADAARLMLKHRIGGLPVVDWGRVIGIVTETDIVRAFAERAAVPSEAVR